MPVLPDDALIMCLDDLPSSESEGKGKAVEEQPSAGASDLQAQLDEVTRQFANYRLAVEQTLDKRWLAEDDASSTSSAGSTRKTKKKTEEKEDRSQYYWESYANHGKLFLSPLN